MQAGLEEAGEGEGAGTGEGLGDGGGEGGGGAWAERGDGEDVGFDRGVRGHVSTHDLWSEAIEQAAMHLPHTGSEVMRSVTYWTLWAAVKVDIELI